MIKRDHTESFSLTWVRNGYLGSTRIEVGRFVQGNQVTSMTRLNQLSYGSGYLFYLDGDVVAFSQDHVKDE